MADPLHRTGGGGSHRLNALLALGGWLALADLDHFIQINDTCVHLVGDQVLHRVARTMQQRAVGRGGRAGTLLRTVRALEWQALRLDVPADWR